MPQTTPARDSTKRRPAAMRTILSLFMRDFSSRMSAPLHYETLIICFILLNESAHRRDLRMRQIPSLARITVIVTAA